MKTIVPGNLIQRASRSKTFFGALLPPLPGAYLVLAETQGNYEHYHDPDGAQRVSGPEYFYFNLLTPDGTLRMIRSDRAVELWDVIS